MASASSDTVATAPGASALRRAVWALTEQLSKIVPHAASGSTKGQS